MTRSLLPFVLAAATCAMAVPFSAATQQAPAPAEEPAVAVPAADTREEEAQDDGAGRADLSPASDLVRDARYAEAIDMLEAIREEFPDDPALLLMLGECLLAERRVNDAVPVLQRAAEIDPDRERTHFQLGSALAATGDAAGALQAFAREIEVTSNDDIVVLSRLNRALLLQRASRWSDAAEELEAVLVIEPQRGEAYGDLATLYIRLERFDDASSALQRGEDNGFVSAAHYYSLGARLFRSERYPEAAAAFERTLAIDPLYALAERSLGETLSRLDRDEEAAAHLRRYLDMRPDAEDREAIEERLRTAGD